jgi:hypothetical protein
MKTRWALAAWALWLSMIGRLAVAQGAPGPRWIEIQSGKTPWYTTPDSIEKIGEDAYRVVFFTEPMAGLRDLYTEELHCADHTARAVRLRMSGSRVSPGTSEKTSPDEPFTADLPGSPSTARHEKTCALARERFKTRYDHSLIPVKVARSTRHPSRSIPHGAALDAS